MQRERRRVSRAGRRALTFGGALALAVTGSRTALAAASNPVAGAEWALNYLNVTQVRNDNAHGNGVIVAVVDSGVDPNQADLQGRLVDGVNLSDPNNPSSTYSDPSPESHGTSVATVLAGLPHLNSSGDRYGMIGLADGAKIMPIETGSDKPTSDSIAAGILYAINHGAQVINISIAVTGPDPEVVSAINKALAAGVVVAAGAGNDANSGNQPSTIASVPGVLDVGGIDSNNQKYSFGHYGSDVNITAPANAMEVGLNGGAYGTNSGTSFATPLVSAEAALLIAEHPTWTSGQIVATIIDNTMQVADHSTSSGQRVNDNLGYGVIDPVAALGASEPSNTANPLGGPAITSNPAQNLKNGASSSASAGATQGPGTNGNPPSASGKSSSKTPLIIGIVVVVVVLIALLVFLLSRRNRGGKGGPGGGGGGGSNGYYTPPNQPGGQYAVPPQQQQNPYQQQNSPNPYAQQPQQQQPGAYPPPQSGGGGYGQQQYPNTGR